MSRQHKVENKILFRRAGIEHLHCVNRNLVYNVKRLYCVFQAVVDQSKGQFVDIDVLDQDPGDDDELGR